MRLFMTKFDCPDVTVQLTESSNPVTIQQTVSEN